MCNSVVWTVLEPHWVAVSVFRIVFCFRCVQGFEFRVVMGSGMVKSGLLSLEMTKGAFCVRTLWKVELHGR